MDSSVTDDRVRVEEETAGVTVVTLRGQLDHAFAGMLQKLFSELITEGDRTVLLDLGEAETVCSVVLGVLFGGAGRLRRCGGDLKVCSVPAGLRDTFEVVRIDSFLDVYPDRPKALAACVREQGARRNRNGQ